MAKIPKLVKTGNRAFPVPRTRQWLTYGPNLSKFLGYLGSEFGDAFFLSFVLLKVYFISVSPFTAFISIICQKYSMVVYI